MDFIPLLFIHESVVSDLIAGLLGSGIVGGGAVLARRVARGTAQRFAKWLGWRAVASAFFGVPLLLTLIDQRWVQAAIVLGVQLAVTAPIMLLRFGPERVEHALPLRIQPPVRFIRTYSWRILTTVFFLITIALLALNLLRDGDGPPPLSGSSLSSPSTIRSCWSSEISWMSWSRNWAPRFSL